MASTWTLITVSLALIVAFFPGDSAAERSIGEIETECDDAKCEEKGSPYCFGFLMKDAKTENGGRDTLPADADGCFKSPTQTNCEGKPWVAVKKIGQKFSFELISSSVPVGMILYKDADPVTSGLVGVLCGSDNSVKVWTSNLFGDGGTPAANGASSGTLCTFELDLSPGSVGDLSQSGAASKVAFFEGADKPADAAAANKLTSSDTALTFWSELQAKDGEGTGSNAGGSSGGGPGRSVAGGGAILVAVSSIAIAMIVWSG